MRNNVFSANPSHISAYLIKQSVSRSQGADISTGQGEFTARSVELMKSPSFSTIAKRFRELITAPSLKTFRREQNEFWVCKDGLQEYGCVPQLSHDEISTILRIKKKNELKLLNYLGTERFQNKIKNFVRHWDIAIIHAEADKDFALQCRDTILQAKEGVAVTGRWDVRRGDITINPLSMMVKRSKVLLVLVSKAFMEERLLSRICSMLITSTRNKYVIPIYLEKIKKVDYPKQMEQLKMFQGIDAECQTADDVIGKLIPWFPKAMAIRRHLYETKAILKLIEDIENNEEYL